MKTPYNPHRRSVPAISASKHADKQTDHSVSHWLMMACCVAMFPGVGLIILAAPEGQSLTQVLWAASPLLACLGMHLVMHKVIGMSCHSNTSKKDTEQ